MTINWKEFTPILVCGIIGGFAGWCFSVYATHDFGTLWGIDILTSVLFGALAAWIAIYVLTPTDTKQVLRTLALAVLAGSSWKLVWITGQSQMANAINHRAASESKDKLQTAIDNAKPEDPKSAAALISQAADLTEKLGDVKNPELVKSASSVVTSALNKAALTSNPIDIKPDDIAQIAILARTFKLREVNDAAKTTTQKLTEIKLPASASKPEFEKWSAGIDKLGIQLSSQY